MKTLIFTNQKGGTGKTTSAISCAAGLSRKGYRVLLVDADPQGDATTAARAQPDEKDPTLYEILTGQAKAADVIRPTAAGFDIIPTDIRQVSADIDLANTPGRNFILRGALATVAGRYDYAIIDSPRALDITSIMGLTAADGIIITIRADYLSLTGAAHLMQTIDLVKATSNPRLEILGVLLTFYNARTNIAKTAEAHTVEAFRDKVFNTKISPAAILSEVPAQGGNIFTYRPRSKSAAQYEALTEEIIARCENTQRKKGRPTHGREKIKH